MPKKLIEQLGLIPFRPQVARTPTGLATFQIYGAARLLEMYWSFSDNQPTTT